MERLVAIDGIKEEQGKGQAHGNNQTFHTFAY